MVLKNVLSIWGFFGVYLRMLGVNLVLVYNFLSGRFKELVRLPFRIGFGFVYAWFTTFVYLRLVQIVYSGIDWGFIQGRFQDVFRIGLGLACLLACLLAAWLAVLPPFPPSPPWLACWQAFWQACLLAGRLDCLLTGLLPAGRLAGRPACLPACFAFLLSQCLWGEVSDNNSWGSLKKSQQNSIAFFLPTGVGQIWVLDGSRSWDGLRVFRSPGSPRFTPPKKRYYIYVYCMYIYIYRYSISVGIRTKPGCLIL